MAKKTVRTAKPTQQRSKEEQWRKRMAAQTRTGTTPYVAPGGAGSAVAEPEDDVETYESEPVGTAATAAPAPAPVPRPQAPRPTAASTARTSAAQAAQRRNLAAQRPIRPRAGITNTMTIDEEMHHIRADIRRLIILTAICIVILIILAFIVPSIVK